MGTPCRPQCRKNVGREAGSGLLELRDSSGLPVCPTSVPDLPRGHRSLLQGLLERFPFPQLNLFYQCFLCQSLIDVHYVRGNVMILVKSSKLEKTGCITAFYCVPGCRPAGKAQQNQIVCRGLPGPAEDRWKTGLPHVILNEVVGSTELIN